MTTGITHYLLLTLLLLVGMSTSAQSGDKVSATELEEALQETAHTMNAKLPRMLDEDVQLTSTKGGNRKFLLNYTFVNYSASQVNATLFRARRLQHQTEEICLDGAMKEFIDLGVSITYTYFGNDGKKITSVTITPAMCKKAKAR